MSEAPRLLPIDVVLGYSVRWAGERYGRPGDRSQGAREWPGEWYVTLDHSAGLTELVRSQFAPQFCPEYEDATLGEVLWAFLPVLVRRFGTPEVWRSRRLLPPPQERAAQALSFRLNQDGWLLPRTFSVTEMAPEDFMPPPSPAFALPPALDGVRRGLKAWLNGTWDAARPVPVSPVAAITGTQATLLASPAVRALRRMLEDNQRRAAASADARWRYHARAALTEYLPETVQLFGENGGRPDDPEFLQALDFIRRIATAGEQEQLGRWQTHLRFLEDKVRSL